MSNYHPVYTQIWNDNKFTEYEPSKQLLFLYLITNSNCKITGIYQVSLKQIYCSTNIEIPIIKEILQSFDKSKVEYDFDDGIIFVKNFFKHNLGKGGNPKVIHKSIESGLNLISNKRFITEFNKINIDELNKIRDKTIISNNNSTVTQQLDNSYPTVSQQLNNNKDKDNNSNNSSSSKKESTDQQKATDEIQKRTPKPKKDYFEEFWKIYNYKKARGDAIKAFEKAIKIETPEKIIAGARLCVRNRDPDPNKCPSWKYPATWLNQLCWDDEYKESTSGNSGDKPLTEQERKNLKLCRARTELGIKYGVNPDRLTKDQLEEITI